MICEPAGRVRRPFIFARLASRFGGMGVRRRWGGYRLAATLFFLLLGCRSDRRVEPRYNVPDSRSAATSPTRSFENLDTKIAVTQDAFKRGFHAGDGALIYCNRSSDGLMVKAEVRLDYTSLTHAGMQQDVATEGQCTVLYGPNGDSFDLQLWAPGYHQFHRAGVFREGKITVWDDIVLDKVTDESGAIIEGIVRLDDGRPADEILVRLGNAVQTKTDREGRFRFANCPEGVVAVYGRKTGYTGLTCSPRTRRGETSACELLGFRVRTAIVRWVYQPSASRDLVNGVESGIAILGGHRPSPIKMSDGFQLTPSGNDFDVVQEGQGLKIRIPATQPPGPGILRITGTSYDQIMSAPTGDYGRAEFALEPGAVLVLRSLDSEHYAKLEVLRVVVGEASEEVINISVSTKCRIFAPASEEKIRLAITDFECGNVVTQDEAAALTDLFRSTVYDTDAFVLIDAESLANHAIRNPHPAEPPENPQPRGSADGARFVPSWVLGGRLSAIDDSRLISLQVFDVRDGQIKVLETREIGTDLEHLRNEIQDLGCEMARRILSVSASSKADAK